MEQKLDLKKEKVNKIITVILVGLLLLIIVVPIGDGDKANDNAVNLDTDNASANMEGTAVYYEERLKDILEKSYGEGTMEVMVHMKEEDGTDSMYEEGTLIVDGILIVAEVSDDRAVADISFAVCALFDLPAHKVAVIKN